MAEAEPSVRSYRLDPGGFEPTLKRRVRRSIAGGVPLLLLVAVPFFLLLAHFQRDATVTLPFTIPLCLGLFAFGYVRSLRRQRIDGRAAWESYQLTLSPNVMRRFISNLPAAEVVRPEVTRIVDAPGEGLTVATADAHRFIFIPEQLIDFAEVRAQLSGWRAFEPPKVVLYSAARMGWTLLLLGLWVASGMIPDFGWAMLAGVLLLAVAGYTLRETLKLRVVDGRFKARAVVVLGFFMLAPVARVLMHFAFGTGPQWN